MLNPIYKNYARLVEENFGRSPEKLRSIVRTELLNYAGKELSKEERLMFVTNPEENLKNFYLLLIEGIQKAARINVNFREAVKMFSEGLNEALKVFSDMDSKEARVMSQTIHRVNNEIPYLLSIFDRALHSAKNAFPRDSQKQKEEYLLLSYLSDRKEEIEAYETVAQNPQTALDVYKSKRELDTLSEVLEKYRSLSRSVGKEEALKMLSEEERRLLAQWDTS